MATTKKTATTATKKKKTTKVVAKAAGAGKKPGKGGEEQVYTPEQLLEMVEKGEIQPDYIDEPPNTMTEENWEKFVMGEITWAQLEA